MTDGQPYINYGAWVEVEDDEDEVEGNEGALEDAIRRAECAEAERDVAQRRVEELTAAISDEVEALRTYHVGPLGIPVDAAHLADQLDAALSAGQPDSEEETH